MSEDKGCQECLGTTIMFSGKGKDTQYKICSHWQEPGHVTEDEIKQRIYSVRMAINPSGRFA